MISSPTIPGVVIGIMLFIALSFSNAKIKDWLFFASLTAVAIFYWSVVSVYCLHLYYLAKSNPGQTGVFVFAYMFAGVLVALFKWRGFVSDCLKELCEDGLKEFYRHPEDMHLRTKESFTEYIHKRIPSPTNSKSTIAGWISYWPFVLLDVAATFVFRDLFNKIADWTSFLFKKVTDVVVKSVFKSYEDRLESTIYDVNMIKERESSRKLNKL